MKQIFLISGEPGSGKTSLVINLLSEINKLGIKNSGIYSPARFENGTKTGIYAVDLSTGNKELLAIHQPGWDADNPKREWKMDLEVLNWGDNVIRDSAPTNVLIIDELGYLEFEKKMGWMSAFKVLDEGNYINALVVVRTGLLDKALNIFENVSVITVEDPAQINDHFRFLISQILVS